MPTGFTWGGFVSHLIVAVLAYFGGLFTPPPGSQK